VIGEPVTGATDLYAVGAVLYEALTGSMAFAGATLFELLRRIVSDPPKPPVERRPDLAGPFEMLILRALSKKPGERFASAQEMAAELEAIRNTLGPEAWAPLPGRATGRQPLTMGSEATLLPGDQPLAMGSEATMLAGDRKLDLGTDATMAAEQLAPGAVISGTPGTGATIGFGSSAGNEGRNTSYSAKTHSTKSKKPLALGLAALGVVSAATIAVVLSRSSSSVPRQTSILVLEKDASLTPQDRAIVSASKSDDEPARLGDAGAVVALQPTRPGGPPLDSSTPRRKPEAQPDSPTQRPVPASPPASLSADAGAKSASSSVTMIETGELHSKSTIRKPPDYNPKAFDAVAYLPKARQLAKQIYSDAVLIEFDVEGVGANGKSNLALANFEATYNFLSRSHGKRTMPIGVDEDRACWVYVEVDKKGVTARIDEQDTCKGKARPNPKCSMRDVWRLSDAIGTAADKGNAVAHITYLWDGWFFEIDALGVTGSINDDC
jgi:serine/threonine protein kinase